PIWTGYVDLREVVTNHIKPDKHQPLCLDDRRNPGTDFPVTGGQFTPLTPATGRQVPAIFPLGGNSRKGVGHRFTVDQQDTFVTLSNFGNELLRHGLVSTIVGKGLNDNAKRSEERRVGK